MSRSAFSAKGFAVYQFLLGSLLVAPPNVALTLFGMPLSTDAWIVLPA